MPTGLKVPCYKSAKLTFSLTNYIFLTYFIATFNKYLQQMYDNHKRANGLDLVTVLPEKK